MTVKMALGRAFGFVLLLLSVSAANSKYSWLPLVINTWPFTNATEKGKFCFVLLSCIHFRHFMFNSQQYGTISVPVTVTLSHNDGYCMEK